MQTRLLEIDPLEDSDEIIQEVKLLLEAGQIVALPTETVYGLAADAMNEKAVSEIFDIKGRPRFDPLIVHLASGKDLSPVACVPAALEKIVLQLAKEFWPGPMTLVLPKSKTVPDIVTAGLATVAVRVSAHPVMRGVCKALGRPIAAPSANRFGKISPTSARAVRAELDGKIPLIVDAGACAEGIESTIVRPKLDERGNPVLEVLRAGPITKEQLRKFGKVVFIKKTVPAENSGENPAAPGQLESHYAPTKPLILFREGDEFAPVAGKRYALLTLESGSKFSSQHDWARVVELSPGSGKLTEAAVRLFAMLRQLDDDVSIDVIVAESVAERGVGVAIMDRLTRASQKN